MEHSTFSKAIWRDANSVCGAEAPRIINISASCRTVISFECFANDLRRTGGPFQYNITSVASPPPAQTHAQICITWR
jgi:hypothetical protein